MVRSRSNATAGRTSFHEVRRGHAADSIFEQLAAAVLRGELTPGEPLPPERILGEQFGVSRIILRAAVHRLAEVGLVRVRQGGASIVLDPAEAGDIRLIGLYYSLDPGGEAARAIRRDAIEKQFLQGFSLIDVCARRGSASSMCSVGRPRGSGVLTPRWSGLWIARCHPGEIRAGSLRRTILGCARRSSTEGVDCPSAEHSSHL